MINTLNIRFLIVSALLAFSLPVQALVILQKATIPIDTQYDTNPTLSSSKQSIWRYTTTPTYSIAAVDGLNRWYTNAGLSVQRSSDKRISQDRQDPNLDIGWQRELQKGSFSLSTHYDKSSTRFSEFEENGLIDQDGSAVNRSISASWTRLITERLNLSLGSQYQTTKYEGSGFTDSVTKSINSTLSYDWSEKISPFVQLTLTDFKPDGTTSQPSKSKNVLVGAKFSFAPRWIFSPSVGVNKVSSLGTGFVTSNNLSYLSERSDFYASLSRSVSPSGLGNFQQSDQFGVGYSYSLTERSKVGTTFSKNKNKSISNSESTQFSASYSYELTNQWDMRVMLEARNQKNITQNVNGKTLGLTLTYNIPEF